MFAIIHPSAWNKSSANFAFTEFFEVRLNGVLRSLGGFVLWSIYTPLKQYYTAFVAWPSRRCVKVQDSYLPSS